jgi:diaminopimelate decarboxylase
MSRPYGAESGSEPAARGPLVRARDAWLALCALREAPDARTAVKLALGQVVRGRVPPREDLPLGLWRLARDAAGALTIDGVALGELLARHGSPLHVVDATRLAQNAARFLARPAGVARACEAYVSYKTNPVPGVLRMLHASGVGAEAASPYELWLALELGVAPDAILFNGPAKSEASLVQAISRDVALINANSRDELDEIAKVARGLGKRARVGLRVVPPGFAGGQFGVPIDGGAALAAYRHALSLPELRVVALHAHRNGELATGPQLDAFLEPLLAFTDALRGALGLELEILDVGGNLACPTTSHLSGRAQRLAVTFGCEPSPRPPASVLSIDRYVARLAAGVESHFAARGARPPRVFVEPGRALMSDAQLLLTRVIGLRAEDPAGMRLAMLDAGFNVAEPVRNELHQLLPLVDRRDRQERGAPSHLYRLVGPTCSVGDLLYPAWRLPELAIGDGLAIMDTGAYFVPASACFSFPRPAIVAIENGRVTELRRAESYDDLVSLDASPRARSPGARVRAANDSSP